MVCDALVVSFLLKSIVFTSLLSVDNEHQLYPLVYKYSWPQKCVSAKYSPPPPTRWNSCPATIKVYTSTTPHNCYNVRFPRGPRPMTGPSSDKTLPQY